MQHLSPHTFHIPVMGLAYTIDSPVKVARFGITSTISITADRLIEMMRRYYYGLLETPYIPISAREEDYRARRITDYLNLVNRMVKSQVEQLKASAFKTGSDIHRYFELLPEDSALKGLYRRLLQTEDEGERSSLETLLREGIVPGSIDVNIMTKVDKDNVDGSGAPLPDGSDALAALRGYAQSDLTNSSIIFSAGLNPRLYNYLEKLPQFAPNEQGAFDKKVVIKVSDYRSALVQGKYLAKKGIWVSEFRIESGLNCGGHAFASDGYLLGPILEEFKSKKAELSASLFDLYQAAVRAKTGTAPAAPYPIALTVQGGIGTAEEDRFLRNYYGVDSTGWGTPFLLVPEATTVDAETLELLCAATEGDVELSRNSPLGVRFHYLKGTSSEREKKARAQRGRPGSPCTEKHLVSNTEFTREPICTASHKYQQLKLAQLQALDLHPDDYRRQEAAVLAKECLCVGLSNAAASAYDQVLVKNTEGVTICPGPNIAYFSQQLSLQQMIDHIYGRQDHLGQPDRPHMFIKELQLYVAYRTELQAEEAAAPDAKKARYIRDFTARLLEGIGYYRQLFQIEEGLSAATRAQVLHELDQWEAGLNS
ncbi:hypothetical protein V9K67_16360 [Paraflavisolibacter sp. H34]|uniref:hypothetical protein n=1 Tax=Huijunlia imazamoxiresistens TaxID=3127457 RepID=UPI003016614A